MSGKTLSYFVTYWKRKCTFITRQHEQDFLYFSDLQVKRMLNEISESYTLDLTDRADQNKKTKATLVNPFKHCEFVVINY